MLTIRHESTDGLVLSARLHDILNQTLVKDKQRRLNIEVVLDTDIVNLSVMGHNLFPELTEW